MPEQSSADYTWTCGNDIAIIHIRAIDAGSGGEVHEVRLFYPKSLLGINVSSCLTVEREL